MSNELTDDQIREQLSAIDDSEAVCSAWEGDFLENVLFRFKGPLTKSQRTVALRMIETYERFL
jgi:hypothetical protein